jgi:thymidylate synthase
MYSSPIGSAGFRGIYEEILWKTLRRGHEERNERTGHTVRVYPLGPVSFSIDLGEDNTLPVVGNRKTFPATAAAEVAWMLMGTRDASFMLKHARVVWEKFVEPLHDYADNSYPDHPIEFQGVKAAYGFRWRKHFGRDQLSLAVQALIRNPSDRRIWVSAWDPAEDGLGATGQLNVPCPVGFTLSIVDGRLCSALTLRSSDLFVGLPYDVMGHAMLMAVVAATLKIELGFMHFTLAHPHLYDSHFEFAEESMLVHGRRAKVALVRHDLQVVEKDPEAFVALYKARGQDEPWPAYCPKPAVIP